MRTREVRVDPSADRAEERPGRRHIRRRDGHGRLDQPRQGRRLALRRPGRDPDAFGRVSESIARYFGTARYIVIQTILVIIWIGFNVGVAIDYHANHPAECAGYDNRAPRCAGAKPFDPYPFILLNLAFSTQAAYAAPLILLAQNRQADRDRVQAEQDRARDERTVADTEYLTREVAGLRISLGEVATRDFLRSELQRLLEEDRRGRDGDEPA